MKKIVLVIVFSFLLPLLSSSMGAIGHKIIASIAYNILNQSTRDSIQKYLGNMNFEEASIWMDEIRGDKTYDYMKPWHYINIEKDKTYVKNNEKNIINQIEESILYIKSNSKKKEQINFHIKVLFHLIGDIHQPLHCGYEADKGGNLVYLKFIGKNTNLHKVWDSELINETKINLNDCLKIMNKMTLIEKKNIASSNKLLWMQESIDLLPEVYNFKESIEINYVNKNKNILEKQIIKAGIRLAFVFTELFK